jgi:hypothetical protein
MIRYVTAYNGFRSTQCAKNYNFKLFRSYLKGLKKTTKTSGQDSRFAGRDSNQAPFGLKVYSLQQFAPFDRTYKIHKTHNLYSFPKQKNQGG